MTDDTQPEAMDLADWLEAVGGGPSAKRCAALLREQHARIAELESELEAVGAGGVQALSAAPAIGDELRDTLVAVSAAIAEQDDRTAQKMIREILAASPTPPAEQAAPKAAPVAFLKSVIALCSHRGYSPANIEVWDKYDKWIADLWRQAESMLAASPTPPAEQQAPKETLGGVNGWRDISTAPKDGSRFVAIGHNYWLYSEVRHICIAQWFRGCWMEASDWNETSELKYLTHWMPLPPLPGNAARKQGGA